MKQMMQINGFCDNTETIEYKANKIQIRLNLLWSKEKKDVNTVHPTALQASTQEVGGKIRISGRIRTLYSQSDFRGKNWLFGLLFFKT